MKKISLALCIVAFALPLFADDALVLPARVVRFYSIGNYATISKSYDSEWKGQDIKNNMSILNLGAAVEYGINDWISGALQWAPGYNVYSKIDGVDKGTLADAADLFVGAKVQLVGPRAPIQNETFRFAVAPGVKIPLSHPDWEKEYSNSSTKDFLVQAADKHTLGIGGRAYFDYVINEMFFLNLYSQCILYPADVDLKDTGLHGYGSWYALHSTGYAPKLNYGYDLTFEFEPHYSSMLGDGLQISAGLPLTFTMSPKESLSGDTTVPSGYETYAYVPNGATRSLSIGPNVSLFFQKALLPIEVKAGYTFPLTGENTYATDVLLLEFKVYAKL